jgi:hypothetical protein
MSHNKKTTFGKLFSAITGPLLAVASTLIPGGPLILGAVNALLPDDKKLPATATGGEICNAVNALTPDQKSSLMEKELEVEIAEINAWAGIQESFAKADASGSSTRPYIAMMMAWCVVIEIAVVVLVWAIAVFDDDLATLKILKDSWPMLLALIATPTALLRAYFGMRTKEKQSRYSALSGHNVSGGFAGLIKAFKG